MIPFFSLQFGNAASRNHSYGLEAKEAVKVARTQIANLINGESKQIIFTSGATEAINLGIRGIIEPLNPSKTHIIVSSIEHNAVLDVCKYLEERGCSVSYIPINNNGIVDPNEIEQSIRAETKLVCVMHVNNEIGTIQPISHIGKICQNRRIPFFVDCAQSAGKIPIDIEAMNIDILSLSAHKMYGPKGVGCLYVNPETFPLLQQPLIFGGGHERGLRSGTLNVPGIVGFGKAAEISQSLMNKESKRIVGLRNYLLSGLENQLNDFIVNGDLIQRLPGNLSVSFGGLDGESLLRSFKVFAVSSGSACTTDSIEPSHVLKALAVPEKYIESTIRFGIGRFNTKDEIEFVIEETVMNVNRLRELKSMNELFV